MRRDSSPPRPDWRRRVEGRGFTFHTADGVPYWNESACYTFTKGEVDSLELATNALHEMCLALVQRVIDDKLFALFLIPPGFEELVVRSWNDDEPTVYGRFDLAFDGSGPPKLLEYNADTPTSLLEAAVIQWDWLTDLDPHGDQFNSIDEKLVELAWPAVLQQDDNPVHFAADRSSEEDAVTADYMRDTAVRAGVKTAALDVSDIGFDARRRLFVGRDNEPLRRVFKLYPWEWLTRDEFGPHALHAPTAWTEPPWKMLLSAKAILPMLYEMFPESPYLLPASFDPLGGDCVRKPVHGREGANIEVIRGGNVVAATPGPYATDRAVVYQQLARLFQDGGRHAVIGSWVINGWAAGIGVREDDSIVTRNTSRFVPHRMV